MSFQRSSAELVADPPVELDVDPLVLVGDVPVDDTPAGHLPQLADTAWQSVRPLDPADVRALQRRLHALSGLGQHARAASADAGSAVVGPAR